MDNITLSKPQLKAILDLVNRLGSGLLQDEELNNRPYSTQTWGRLSINDKREASSDSIVFESPIIPAIPSLEPNFRRYRTESGLISETNEKRIKMLKYRSELLAQKAEKDARDREEKLRRKIEDDIAEIKIREEQRKLREEYEREKRKVQEKVEERERRRLMVIAAIEASKQNDIDSKFNKNLELIDEDKHHDQNFYEIYANNKCKIGNSKSLDTIIQKSPHITSSDTSSMDTISIYDNRFDQLELIQKYNNKDNLHALYKANNNNNKFYNYSDNNNIFESNMSSQQENVARVIAQKVYKEEYTQTELSINNKSEMASQTDHYLMLNMLENYESENKIGISLRNMAIGSNYRSLRSNNNNRNNNSINKRIICENKSFWRRNTSLQDIRNPDEGRVILLDNKKERNKYGSNNSNNIHSSILPSFDQRKSLISSLSWTKISSDPNTIRINSNLPFIHSKNQDINQGKN